MTRYILTALTFAAVSASVMLGGCSAASTTQARLDQPMPAHLELAMGSALPTFGVGDELGWLAFGDLAIAPQPGEPRDVLVIVRAHPVDADPFDWLGQYLALAQ